ncbi:MAG: hypothetical protein H6742_22070 [Alphaproteobacteria bacterium]|nr:hypothetical protein [Alphaproteobacteria bacterium]
MLALLLLGLSPASALEWRAGVGGEFNAEPHGILDIGVRDGRWSLQLLTDTLDARHSPEWKRGKAWVALRGEGGAAGLFISPWTDGGPDEGRSLLSHYVGAEAGAQRYLPHGFYAGVQGSARYQLFGAMATATVPVPEARPVLGADVVLGWWSPQAALYSRTGLQGWTLSNEPWTVAPHSHLQATAAPDWTLAPTAALSCGFAWNQDDVTRTRLGGLNPYVVPLAGAAWAEWWVESYVAARLGPRYRLDFAERGRLDLSLLADVASAAEIRSSQPAGPWATGFSLWARGQRGRSFLDLAAGYAPWIERQPDVGRLSVFVHAGVEWGESGRIFRTAD